MGEQPYPPELPTTDEAIVASSDESRHPREAPSPSQESDEEGHRDDGYVPA